jgi:hypothetical protein
VGVDADRVAYYTILDSVPSVELCSSSSNDSSGSGSVMASPPPVLDVHIFTELRHMTEVPGVGAAEQDVAVDTEAHAASSEGWFSPLLQISRVVINCGDFDFGCIGVHDDDSAEVDLRQLARGLPSSGFADDDEQIVQYLEHVRLLCLLWYFSRLDS